jgi:hypothetical protein
MMAAMTAAPGHRLLIFWLAFGLVMTAAPALAAAGDKTLVLLEVEGESTPRLAKALERMIKTEHEVMPGSVYRDAARRLRARKLTPNNVKKVCAYLKVDGVLDGTVVQEDGSYRFIVRLRSGSKGIIEKKIPLRMANAWLSEEMSNRLSERLMSAIDNLPAVDKDGRDATMIASDEDRGKSGKQEKDKKRRGDDEADDDGDDGEDDEDEEVASSSRSRKGVKRVSLRDLDKLDDEDEDKGKEKNKGKSKSKGKDDTEDEGEGEGEGDDGSGRDVTADADDSDEGDDADGDDGDDEGEDDLDGSLEDDAELAASRTTPRTTPLLVNAGVSFIGRKLAFSSVAGAADPPPGYSGTPVPGAYIVGEAYPGVFAGKKGILANLGLGFVIDRVIKLNSAVPDSTGMGTVNLSTRMWRYGANLRYRHNFGSEPNGYSIQTAIGFNTAGFAISKGDAPNGSGSVDVPNVNYKYIDAGVGGRIPIAGKLSFLAEAKFLSPLSTGQIQSTTHYGPASVIGFDGEGAFEYQITPSIQARAGGRIMYLKYSFDGSGALDDRDMNGSPDVTGASDRFFGGFLTGGYSF